MDTNRVVQVSVIWMTLAYVVCFVAVALAPDLRPWFMEYALHTSTAVGQNAVSWFTFFTGLVIWDVLTAIAVGSYAYLYNKIK